MNTLAEARAAPQAAHATGLPVWDQLRGRGDGHLLSGEALPEVEAEAILVNTRRPRISPRGVEAQLSGA